MSTAEATQSRPARTSIDEVVAQDMLHELVASMKTAILSTVGGTGQSDASYAPCITDEAGHFYIYVSTLAKHTANLKRSDKMSLMVIEDESTAESLYARRRATWTCGIGVVERESEEFNSLIARFQERFGSIMENLANMQDFHLFRLTPEDGRLVLGFGAAFRMIGWEVQKQMHGRHQTKKN